MEVGNFLILCVAAVRLVFVGMSPFRPEPLRPHGTPSRARAPREVCWWQDDGCCSCCELSPLTADVIL
jgi:hypothetical protein